MKTLLIAIGFAASLSIGSVLAGDAHSPAEKESDSFWKTFIELRAGNERFATGHPEHAAQDARTRGELVKGQHPHTVVLSCSDSRVPPELIFDQGLGKIFTVRIAGEVPDAAAIASIEYAVEHLGVGLLVVLGHESCGAVKAAIATPEGKSAGSPYLDALIGDIRPHLDKNRSLASEDAKLRQPVRDNVSGVVADLFRKSKILREHAEQNKLLVAQGIYSLETGKVDFWSAAHPVVEKK
jgi:carbonic anhydrase